MTLYPQNLDGYSSLPLRRDGIDEIRADDVNRLRNAIVAIEQELGVSPSDVFATVKDRLDSIASAEALISSHIANTVDAHDASAISILDSGDNYVSTEVEGALGELASILPASLDTIGNDNSSIANDGIPSFVGGSGTLHVFTTSGGANEVKKTQPVAVTGVTIVEVGNNNGSGTAYLKLNNHSPATISWQAPGDSFGTAVDISSLSAGEVVTLASSNTTKRIRVARNSSSLPAASPATDTFELVKLNAGTGAFSITGTGIKESNNITRAATTSTGTSRNQFTIGGIVFPADKGTLVLQRKLRLSSDEFSPIAVLDLADNFTEGLRESGQLAYTPTLTGYDIITLFDRLPARKDYETLDTDADGNAVYENFDIDATFTPFQVAKYLIPVSNSLIANGQLQAPTDTTASEIDSKVSAYRLVHYRDGVTDFTGEPSSSNIFSLSDPLAGADDGDNNVRMSNVYVDTNAARPTLDSNNVVLRPVLDTESVSKIISGLHYYNGSADLFDIEIKSDSNLFSNAYLKESILRFTTDALEFPEGDGYGLNVDVEKLLDDGYEYFSAENVPVFTDTAFYLVNATFLDGYRPYIGTEKYSNNTKIATAFYDPFGAGTLIDGYGRVSGNTTRIFANSFSTSRASATQEWFTDESRRVGTSEVFDFALDANQFTGAGSGGTLDAFDGTSALSAGELQCGGLFTNPAYPGLVYPQEDHDPSTSSIRPLQQSGTDYSAYSGDATYQRLFTLGRTTNGGYIRIVSSGDYPVSFDDIDYNNASRPIKIAVKIPGTGNNSTGWLDIGRLFETAKFDDDDGALSGPSTGVAGDFRVPFTFGNRNNADTGNMIAIRITYLSSALADAKTRIISSIELLAP